METIHTGWLIKSPKDRPWKLLKPKWRKRYFVLCVSQASTTLPGQCPAILDYYDSDKQSHKRGSIDLNSCDEVQTKLTFQLYENVFSLRQKQKDSHRMYFLAAESEDEMNRWVQCLCTVLQLDDGLAESSNDASASVSSSPGVVDERYVRVPQLSTTPPILIPPPPCVPLVSTGNSLHPNAVNHPLPGEFDLTSSSLTPEDTGEAYIFLDECFSGAVRKGNSQRTNEHCASSNPVSHAAYAVPKGESSRTDQKSMEYCNVSNGDEIEKKHLGATQSNHGSATVVGSSTKISDHPSNVSNQKSRIIYANHASTSDEPHRAGADRKMDNNMAKYSNSVIGHSIHNTGHEPAKSMSHLPISVSERDYGCPSYINLSTGKSVHQYMNAPSVPLSSQSPCSSPKSHGAVNGSHMTVTHSVLNNSASKKLGAGHLAPPIPAEAKLDPTRIEAELEPPVMSGRSQSFKRNIIHTDVPLPIKKFGQNEESSSSDDDASDEDSPLYRSYEDKTNHDEPPPIPLPPKKRSLDMFVQPPKDAIQYLDLNLPDAISGGEKSPAINRSMQHVSSSETNYNEIDWVKTKALLETKKDLESERHGSEKSTD